VTIHRRSGDVFFNGLPLVLPVSACRVLHRVKRA
jgi:hypothetical protein